MCNSPILAKRERRKKSKLLQRTSKSNILFVPAWHWHWNRIYWCFWTRAAEKKSSRHGWQVLMRKYSFIRLILLDHPFICRMKLKSLNWIYLRNHALSSSPPPIYGSHPNFDIVWAGGWLPLGMNLQLNNMVSVFCWRWSTITIIIIILLNPESWWCVRTGQ